MTTASDNTVRKKETLLYINLYSPKHDRNPRQKDRYIQQKEKNF